MERREGVTGTVVRKEKEQMICGCVYICSPWSQSPPRPFAEKTCGAQLRLSALFGCRENRALPTGFFIWQFRTIQAVPDAVNSESIQNQFRNFLAHKQDDSPLNNVKRLREGGPLLHLEEQYDRIYKYLYFRLHDRHAAEDMTQEAFLRFLRSRTYRDENRQLQYLYTIARNLCSQYYRDKVISYSLDEETDLPETDGFENSLIQRLSLQNALESLSPEEKELLFLRYINDVPVPVISGLYQISRFAVYRKLKSILQKVRIEMEEDQNE